MPRESLQDKIGRCSGRGSRKFMDINDKLLEIIGQDSGTRNPHDFEKLHNSKVKNIEDIDAASIFVTMPSYE